MEFKKYKEAKDSISENGLSELEILADKESVSLETYLRLKFLNKKTKKFEIPKEYLK